MKNFGLKNWEEKTFPLLSRLRLAQFVLRKEANVEKVRARRSLGEHKGFMLLMLWKYFGGKARKLLEFLRSNLNFLIKLFTRQNRVLWKIVQDIFHLDRAYIRIISTGPLTTRREPVQCTSLRKEYYLCECQSISRLGKNKFCNCLAWFGGMFSVET